MNLFSSLQRKCAYLCLAPLLIIACIPTTSVLPPSQPQIALGQMASRTRFELQEATRSTDQSSSSRSAAPTKAVFWSAIGLTILGGVSTIALGATAYHTGKQIEDGFTGEFTKTKFDDLEHRGKQLNTATIATASITAVVASIALIVYGVDYSRCGPLAPKRRRCDATRPPSQE